MSNRAESHWQLRRDRLLARPFVHAVQSSRVPIILTDPHEGDHPIVFCNEAFLALTGYGESEVLGRNCRFLQGERTSAEAVAAVRGAIGREEPVSVELLNYRKSGEPFWNELHVAPVYGPGDGRAIYFIGSQIDVTRRRRTQRELEEANRSLEAQVEVRRGRSGALRLSVTDGGRGLPQDFDPARNGGLGMRVIAGNLENLAGTMRVERRARGVAFHIEVPVAG